MRLRTAMAIVLTALLAAGSACAARPPVKDKSGLQGKIFTHANPWYPIDMATVHDESGPDRTWEFYEGTNSWRHCMEVLQSYGVDGINIEMNDQAYAIPPEYRILLDNAPKGFKIGMFNGFHNRNKEETAKSVIQQLKPFKKDLLENPNVLRTDGRPVMLLYKAANKPPEYYRYVFAEIEREICPMVFLFTHSNFLMNCYWGGGGDLETKMHDYMAEFDGVTDYSYSYSTVREHRKVADMLRRIRKDYPDKIYMGTPHAGWWQPYVQGGIDKHLSQDWRGSVDLWLEEDPDGFELTNLFDHSENSHVYPSYEREDLLLRYLEYAVSKWPGRTFRRQKTPELVVCNHVVAQLGWTPLEFEVLGFPIDSSDDEVTVGIELCDTAGKVLSRLGPKKMKLDRFRAEKFTVPSIDFAQERGIVPRLVYKWKGERKRAPYGPMTILSPSIRTCRTYWARSTKNCLELADGSSEDWTLDGVGPGGTRRPTADGQAVFSAAVRHQRGEGLNRGVQRFGILRDGLEHFFSKNLRHVLSATFSWTLPPAGGVLHWYNIEMQNKYGRRWTSLPIWEDAGLRPGKSEMPILDGTNGIVNVMMENVRVPFYYWPCARDGEGVLLDASGHMHNGKLCSDKWNPRWEGVNGELPFVGYNNYHNGAIPANKKFENPFRREADGRGCLQLDGTCFALIQGGTAFPGASTYEISVRPDALGEEMGILDTTHAQVRLVLLPDGHVSLKRRSAPPPGADQFAFSYPEVRSKNPITVGTWTSLAVTYDLRKIALYVNGEKQGEADCAPNYISQTYESQSDPASPRGTNPNCSHECMNGLSVGAMRVDGVENKGRKFFRGGIRQIRAYGRNLRPDEFLTAASLPKTTR